MQCSIICSNIPELSIICHHILKLIKNRLAMPGNRLAMPGNRLAILGNRLAILGNRLAILGNRLAILGNIWEYPSILINKMWICVYIIPKTIMIAHQMSPKVHLFKIYHHWLDKSKYFKGNCPWLNLINELHYWYMQSQWLKPRSEGTNKCYNS